MANPCVTVEMIVIVDIFIISPTANIL